jgi:hypothetical protein
LKEVPQAVNRRGNEEWNQSPGHVDPSVIDSLLTLIDSIPSPRKSMSHKIHSVEEKYESKSPGHVGCTVMDILLNIVETIPSPRMTQDLLTTNMDSPQAMISSSNENVRKLNLSSLSFMRMFEHKPLIILLLLK